MDMKYVDKSSDSSYTDTDEVDESQFTKNKILDLDNGCDAFPSSSRATRSAPAFYRGNPIFGNRMQLYARSNNFLAVYPDGSIRGTQDPNDLHTFLELRNAGDVGHVRIYGHLTRMYVAMDKKGRLYAEYNMWIEDTIFIEGVRGPYKTYLSKKNAQLGWYLGIKKSGKFKKGPHTALKQKAVQFISARKRFQ